MQLVDELSMIYTACLMCYATFSFSQSRLVRSILGVGLASLAIFITVSLFGPHYLLVSYILLALLSFSTRSSFPPKCFRDPYHHHTLTIHVCDGNQHSTLVPRKILEIATERGWFENRTFCKRSTRREDHQADVGSSWYGSINISWWLCNLEPRQRLLFEDPSLEV